MRIMAAVGIFGLIIASILLNRLSLDLKKWKIVLVIAMYCVSEALLVTAATNWLFCNFY